MESTCSQGNRDTQHRRYAPVQFRWVDWSCGPAGENGVRDCGARVRQCHAGNGGPARLCDGECVG
ncbi:MAG: hypothetical protein ACKO96_23975 [Flammeovirgaceae bacterium]